jgi:hypothetical protein
MTADEPLNGPEVPTIVRPADVGAAAISVHLSEYQALTNRITYWISIQYITYSVLGVVLALIQQAWQAPGSNHTAVLWGGLFVVQLAGWAWTFAVWEIHNTAVYLEEYLRPMIGRLISDPQFWCFEPYLARQRQGRTNKIEWKFAVITVAALGLLAFGKLAYKESDICNWHSYIWFLVANLFVAGMIFRRARDCFRLQDKLLSIGRKTVSTCFPLPGK